MADRTQQDRRKLAELSQGTIRKHFAGAQVARATDIVVGVVELDVELRGSHIEHLYRLTDNFRACAVATDHCNIITFHIIMI